MQIQLYQGPCGISHGRWIRVLENVYEEAGAEVLLACWSCRVLGDGRGSCRDGVTMEARSSAERHGWMVCLMNNKLESTLFTLVIIFLFFPYIVYFVLICGFVFAKIRCHYKTFLIEFSDAEAVGRPDGDDSWFAEITHASRHNSSLTSIPATAALAPPSQTCITSEILKVVSATAAGEVSSLTPPYLDARGLNPFTTSSDSSEFSCYYDYIL